MCSIRKLALPVLLFMMTVIITGLLYYVYHGSRVITINELEEVSRIHLPDDVIILFAGSRETERDVPKGFYQWILQSSSTFSLPEPGSDIVVNEVLSVSPTLSRNALQALLPNTQIPEPTSALFISWTYSNSTFTAEVLRTRNGEYIDIRRTGY